MTPAAALQIAPGVVRITLPIPFELSHVNVYLVREQDGWMLIDSGLESERCFETLAAGLVEHGIPLQEIRTVVLTHMHPDHIGLAARVIEISRARLLMHEAELEHLVMIVSGGGNWAQAGLIRGGVEDNERWTILRAVSSMRDRLTSLRPDRLLQGGEMLDTGHGRYEVIWTPGHSPGHICLYGLDSKFLFSGDHILTDITPNISWFPGRDTLADFLASLRELEPYDIDLILPAHGEPFDGHRAWIAETLRHHAERSARLLELLRERPQTAIELVPGVWQGPGFGPFQQYFAVFEVLAHLEHMRRAGIVEASESGAGAAVWRPV
jgi:glyoxylase-like metal-dependent hydrolase (beta-lactamase superfamily II)